MKTIDAVCVTSDSIKRQQISFDEVTGLILTLDEPAEKADYYYGDQFLLFAGMGDVHIHAREDASGKNNYKEDFLSAQKAMHNGGVCHAGDMPNNPIPPVDDRTYEEKYKLALKAAGELWLYAGIGPETKPLSYKVPYKVYMGPSVGELFFQDLKTLDETLSHYQNQYVSFHCEDPEELEKYSSESFHHKRRPRSAEVMATKDALDLIEKYNIHGKLCHYSSGEGLDLIRRARSRGIKVQIEVTPQHLFYDIESLSESSFSKFQMNPPIRYKEDRERLLEALKNGEIDFLATDHAPHTLEEKERGISGLTGLDTFAPFVTWLLEEGVDPKIIAKVACENPGHFFNTFLSTWKNLFTDIQRMGQGVGFLKPGYRANFTVLNLKSPLKITQEMLKTKVRHSPFMDVTFPGKVEALFIGGKKI